MRWSSVRCWLAVLALGQAGCGASPPRPPVTPPLPPLGEGAGDPRPAVHWSDARSTCTGTELPLLFGLLPGHSYRYEAHVIPGDGPPAVEVQLDEGTKRTFRRLQGQVEGRGDASRLVARDGEDLRGQPKVLAWAGVDRRFHFPGERCEEELPSAAAPPPAATPAEPAPSSAALAAPAARARYAAGRPLPWWEARLTALRREGPPELYRVALLRARAAGMSVDEGADAVKVARPEAP